MTKRKPIPPSDGQHLLAAPTETLSPSERAKYYQRKAREEAEAKRVRASKSKERPSIEDMLADLVRVAEDEETNPFWQHRSVSRRRYELFGHYPVAWIDAQFGQFSHALEVAGLRDQPGTTLWRATRARESKRQHAARYVERYVQPYVAKARKAASLGEHGYLLLSISDTHSQFLDPFVWLSFLASIRDLKPDGVLFNGDILDMPEISRHPKVPGWTTPLQDELDFKREMFRQVRKIAGHKGDLFDTAGNHDTDRLAMYLTQVSQALSGLRDLRIDKLMGLDEFGVQLFHGGTIASPRGTEDAKPGFLMFDAYRIHHGSRLGLNPAADELRSAGRSGQSGHVHRAGIAFGTTETTEGMSWMSTPMGCRHEAGRSYVKGVNTGWQRGFGLCRIFPDGSVHQYPVVVVGKPERISVEGFTYTRPAELTDPEPTGVWLKDYNLGDLTR